MATDMRATIKAIGWLFVSAADNYDDHVFEKIRVTIKAGQNVVIEWDDMSDDDVAQIEAT